MTSTHGSTGSGVPAKLAYPYDPDDFLRPDPPDPLVDPDSVEHAIPEKGIEISVENKAVVEMHAAHDLGIDKMKVPAVPSDQLIRHSIAYGPNCSLILRSGSILE